ncbi:hypothetical protein OAV13_00925 [bacterium]|nr:hypothetical protein [bacterium]
MESRGGKKVAQDLDNVASATARVGKNQTRLAQGSASAGRSFAAQSQGLGGVVGVYAAAAANVFALTAAFTALNRAAQFETILRGTESLANAVGTNADSVVKSLKNITSGQLSIVEAATQANLALSAGFNIDQIEQLGQVALKASRALGRNLTDSFQRITRGAIKLEPELLDEIGIFTRIEPAVEAYAASINKSVSSLTRFEKRQAFVSQVIKDGTAAFQDIADQGESTQEVFERLVANFTDLAVTVGAVLADSLAPFARFLDQNLGNRLALLGAVGLLVFGRLRTAITAFATEGLTSLSNRLSNVADGFSKAATQANNFNAAAAGKEAQTAFIGGGALPGAGRAYGAELKRQLGSGLSTAQALTAQKEIPALLQNELNTRKAIEENLNKGVGDTKKLNKELAKSDIRAKALNATKSMVTTQIGAASKQSILLAAGLNLAAAGAQKLGAFIAGALSLLNIFVGVLFGIQLVGSLFDLDFIGFLTEKYKEFTATSRRTKEGLEEIANAADQSSPIFKELADRLEGTADQINKALSEGIKAAGQNQKMLQQQLEITTDRLEKLRDGNWFEKLIAGSIFKDDVKEVEELEQAVRTLTVATDPAIDNQAKLGLVIGTLAEKSDVARQSLGKAVTEGILTVEEGTDKISIALSNGTIELGRFKNGVLEMNTDIEAGAAVTADFVTKLADLRLKLQTGQISADKAGSSYGVLTSQAMKAAELLEKAGYATAANKVRVALSEANQETGKLVESVIALDKFSKDLTKTFSGAFKAVDDAALSGLVFTDGDSVNFARTQEQALLNQSTLITEIISLEGRRGLTLKQSQQIQELKVTAEKAAFGNQLKLLTVLDKQEKATHKRNRALLDQVVNLEMANELNKINLEIAEEQAKLSVEQARRTQIVKNAEQQNKLIKEQNKNLETQADAALELLNLSQDRSKELQKQKNLAVELANLQINSALALKKAQADRQVSIAETRGIATPEAMSNLRIKAAEAAAAIELEGLEQRKQAAFAENNSQIDAINKRIQILEKEFKIEDQKRKNQESIIVREQKLEVTKANNAKADIDAQIKILALQGAAAVQTRENAEMSAKLAKFRQLQEIEIEKQKAILTQKRIEADKLIIGEEVKILNGYRELFSSLTGVSLGQIEIDPALINSAQIDSIIKNLDKQAGFVERIGEEQTKAAQLAEQATVAGIDAQISKLVIEKKGIDNAIDATKELNKTKLDGLSEERQAAVDALVEKAGLAELEKGTVNQNLILRLEQASIERQMAITALEYAKQEERYKLSAQFRLDQALSNSLGIVKGSFTSAFNSLNEQLMNGTLTMNSVGNTFRDMLGGMMRAIQQEVFNTTIAKPIASSITKMLPKLLFAGGGPAHMAGGGSMKRDRIPAMLEPGEFVIRKEAAKMIGLSKLQEMNSGNANIFKMLGMKPVKKVGGGPAGSAGMSGAGTPASNDGFGFGHHDMAASDPGVVGGTIGSGGGAGMAQLGKNVNSVLTGNYVTSAQVQTEMDMARRTGRTVGIVDALDTKPDREERAAQMSKNQSDYEAEIGEKAAKAATAKAVARAKATAINFAVGLVPGVGQLHSAQSLFSGESIGKSMTGEEPFGLGDLFASGGSIRRMAGGGSVNTRDRVPALLEPGEFVIRRPMAKAIGGQALSQMNSTGRPPQISVNLNNSGAPKSVNVQPPKVNGDKIILDIITRDMRNNGSMRKALRRGK